ncbi:hypothetical protein L3Q82_004041 [Scortum barcoo]|uniref:Uncharacterized protein n=1 Tax=Scortum barcoo TaxID=214431 RepID=A0ACB8X886_9TELE|nr:hypothetical protein L3Q82_004041 [Scortum barcoo]
MMMERILLGVLYLSGWYIFSTCLLYQYHFVAEPMNWTEAQTYCREKYTDLATIENTEEMNQLVSTISSSGYSSNVWIGLYSTVSWRWSDGYNGSGAEYRNWYPGYQYENYFCVMSHTYYLWISNPCSNSQPFICNNGTQLNPQFVLVNKAMNWSSAQKYCRENFRDLATVNNSTVDQQIRELSGWTWTWIVKKQVVKVKIKAGDFVDLNDTAVKANFLKEIWWLVRLVSFELKLMRRRPLPRKTPGPESTGCGLTGLPPWDKAPGAGAWWHLPQQTPVLDPISRGFRGLPPGEKAPGAGGRRSLILPSIQRGEQPSVTEAHFTAAEIQVDQNILATRRPCCERPIPSSPPRARRSSGTQMSGNGIASNLVVGRGTLPARQNGDDPTASYPSTNNNNDERLDLILETLRNLSSSVCVLLRELVKLQTEDESTARPVARRLSPEITVIHHVIPDKKERAPTEALYRATPQKRRTAEDDLDESMRKILNEPGLSSYEKIKKYDALLQRYLSLMKQGQKEERRMTLTLHQDSSAPERPEVEPQRETERPEEDEAMSEVLKGLPSRSRKNAEYILQKMKNTDRWVDL